MQLHIFWLHLILTCFNAIESKSLDSFSRACAPEEQVVIEGKCSRYVNDLMYLSEEYPPAKITLAIAKNMSSACGKITSCFGEIECAEGKKNQEVYERKCDNLEFSNYDMRECTRKFYETVYNKSSHCTIEYDFFLTDLKIRRDVYTKGKSCVISIAKKAKCDQKSLEYLNLNYEKFVDLMSVKLDENECNSLHDELIKMQCGPAQSKVERKISEITDNFYGSQFSSQPIQTLDDDICEEIQTCVQGSCFLDGNSIEEFSKGCDQLELEPFKTCETRVKISTLLSKNSCASEERFTTLLNKPSFTSYWEDKECMRILMREKCGNGFMSTFDRDWDNYHQLNNNNNKT